MRRWIREGELEAYSFKRREYRITAAALRDFIAPEQTAAERPPTIARRARHETTRRLA
ncbi:MAG: hypothetical protein IIA55_15025 [Gemmatimonadetes bacterium]|nr:hypothetical protein [Gemmatimonadota bacterium]MCH8146022.1 hypothetical protein [Gemmatimonadota bacterium]MCH8254937.1 hypothetical protein [Gemmatimonadota bacterium]MCH8935777.1 hypothetical protein [Gemmatimonadota bacterium]